MPISIQEVTVRIVKIGRPATPHAAHHGRNIFEHSTGQVSEGIALVFSCRPDVEYTGAYEPVQSAHPGGTANARISKRIPSGKGHCNRCAIISTVFATALASVEKRWCVEREYRTFSAWSRAPFLQHRSSHDAHWSDSSGVRNFVEFIFCGRRLPG